MMNWNGHTIASPEDAGRLDQDHGHRVSLGMEPDMAARGAYADYKHDSHNQAAAYHLKSAQAMQEGGNRDGADRHRLLYKLHIKAAGHRGAATQVPPAVQAHLHSVGTRRPDFFEPHRADGLLTQ